MENTTGTPGSTVQQALITVLLSKTYGISDGNYVSNSPRDENDTPLTIASFLARVITTHANCDTLTEMLVGCWQAPTLKKMAVIDNKVCFLKGFNPFVSTHSQVLYEEFALFTGWYANEKSFENDKNRGYGGNSKPTTSCCYYGVYVTKRKNSCSLETWAAANSITPEWFENDEVLEKMKLKAEHEYNISCMPAEQRP